MDSSKKLVFISRSQKAVSAEQSDKRTGQQAKIHLYDVTTLVPPFVNVTVSFNGTADASDIDGKAFWEPLAMTDLGYTTHYMVYLAEDAEGTNQRLVGTVGRGTNELALSEAEASRNWLLVYAKNPIGMSATAAPYMFQPQLVSSTTTSTTTNTPVDVTGVTFTDTDPDPRHITGIVEWTPPADTSNIPHYSVYIAYDEQNTYGAALIDNELLVGSIPVGTNRLVVYDPTVRQTTNGGSLPANWLLVFTDAALDTNFAAKIRLYDDGSAPPPAATITGMQFNDTATADDGDYVEGVVTWAVDPLQDLAYTAEFEVYLSFEPWAESASQLSVGTVALGTNTLEFGPVDGQGRGYLNIYAKNSYGKNFSHALHIEGLTVTTTTSTTLTATSTTVTTTSTTLTTTSTTLTTTTTTTASITSTTVTTTTTTILSGLGFTDGDADLNEIQGALTWQPPADASTIYNYVIYAANDQVNGYGKEMGTVAVGTNSFAIPADTQRETSESGYPANYLMVRVNETAGLQDESIVSFVPLYDSSPSVPARPLMSITFDQVDPAPTTLSGTLSWTLMSSYDQGLVESFVVYLSDDASGTSKTLIDTVPAGTSRLVLNEVTRGSTQYFLVFARNANGDSLQGASFNYGTTTSTTITTTLTTTTTTTTLTTTSTTVTTTTTTTVTTTSATMTTTTTTYTGTSITTTTASFTTTTVTTTSTTVTTTSTTYTGTSITTTTVTTTTTTTIDGVRGASYVDADSRALYLGGTVYWTPGGGAAAGVVSYTVCISNDDQGVKSVTLWDDNEGLPVVPVGTNKLDIYNGFAQRTLGSVHLPLNLPVNWLIVYANTQAPTSQESCTGLDISNAVAIPLYDSSPELPGVGAEVALTDLAFNDTDSDLETIGGTVTVSPLLNTETEDLGYVKQYAVFVAEQADGTGEVQIGTIPRGTNELAVAPGTYCGPRNFLLVYTQNPTGLTSPARSYRFQDITLSTTTLHPNATSTATATSTTTTTTGIQVQGLTFTDTDGRPNFIAGIVSWLPPADASMITHYIAYIASDENLVYASATLWDRDTIEQRISVGTNQLTILGEYAYEGGESVARVTTDPINYPANWVIVASYPPAIAGQDPTDPKTCDIPGDHSSLKSVLALRHMNASIHP